LILTGYNFIEMLDLLTSLIYAFPDH